MLPLRHARLWQVASLLMLLLVLFVALMPAVWIFGNKGNALLWFESVDKWLHGTTFLVLALWFAGMFHTRTYGWIAIGLLLFGVGIEVCQRFVGYRTGDWVDIGADAAGITAGLVIGMAGASGWCLRVENRVLKNPDSRDD